MVWYVSLQNQVHDRFVWKLNYDGCCTIQSVYHTQKGNFSIAPVDHNRLWCLGHLWLTYIPSKKLSCSVGVLSSIDCQLRINCIGGGFFRVIAIGIAFYDFWRMMILITYFSVVWCLLKYGLASLRRLIVILISRLKVWTIWGGSITF